MQCEDRWAVCGLVQLLLQPRKLAAGQSANNLPAGGIQYDPSEPFVLYTIVQGLIRGQSPKSTVEVLTDIMVSQCGISFRMILLVQLLQQDLCSGIVSGCTFMHKIAGNQHKRGPVIPRKCRLVEAPKRLLCAACVWCLCIETKMCVCYMQKIVRVFHCFSSPQQFLQDFSVGCRQRHAK